MKNKDYIRKDTIDFHLYCRANPLSNDAGGIRRFLEIIHRSAAGFIPTEVQVGKRTIRFEVNAVEQIVSRLPPEKVDYLTLRRESDPAVSYLLAFLGGASPLGSRLMMAIASSYFQDAKNSEARGAELFSFAVELCRAYGLVYGFAHSKADITLGSDPHPSNPFAPYKVYEAFWLNLYGSTMVEEIGRDRVMSVPCYRMEILPDGGVGWLTRPSPADFGSEAARSAQARALHHLLPITSLEDVQKRLWERSSKLAPVERNWDPDIADLLELTLDDVRVAERAQQIAKLNRYRPPEVTEWRQTSQVFPSDVENVEETIDRYSSFYAEQLVALLHKDVPDVMKVSPASLPYIDYHFWHYDYPGTFKREDIDNDLVPALGAFLGEMLVRNLRGRWVPRQKLEESQVVVGNRAWLPFLRAKRYFASAQSVLDYSLTKLYRTAEHYAGLK